MGAPFSYKTRHISITLFENYSLLPDCVMGKNN